MNKPIKPIKGRYAWVEYECGCSEGTWIKENSVCREHNTKIVKASNTVDLTPAKDMVKIKLRLEKYDL